MKSLSKSHDGFTLIEIMIAFTLSAVILGSLSYLLMSALGARKNAAALQTAVFLAQQKMNTIKTQSDSSSDEGEFSGFPGYSFKYDIEETEIDPFAMGAASSEEEQEKQDNHLSALKAYQQSSGGIDDTASGLVLRMREYTVTVFYGNNNKYKLRMFRGLNVSQN